MAERERVSDTTGILDRFDEANAAVLNDRALQDRVDRKYLLVRQDLPALLHRLADDFLLVRAGTRPVATYDTLYFDTPDRWMFDDHRRQRPRRYKVRVRHHLERQLSFLEVKFRQGNGRTAKARCPRPYLDSSLDDDARGFVRSHVSYRPFPTDALVPQAWTRFARATLVGATVNERVTIDWDLDLRDERERRTFGGMVIVEVKQPRYANTTPAVRACVALRAAERSVSKYCLAVATLKPDSRGFRSLVRLTGQLSV